jgi:hypothetical protein
MIHNLPKEKNEYCIMSLLTTINLSNHEYNKFFYIIYALAKQDHELNLKEVIVDYLVYYIRNGAQHKLALEWIENGGFFNEY